jgi:hypothetical protein
MPEVEVTPTAPFRSGIKDTRGQPAASMASQRVRLQASGLSACPGCGLVLPLHGGPTHAYVGASPACWSLYCRELQAVRFAAAGTIVRRLVVDTYALQHPGTSQGRSVQSVAIHAMGLCVLLERGAEERRIKPVLGRRPTRRAPSLYWLDPPCPNGTLTIHGALDADGAENHATAVEAWAANVWAAWEPHHSTIRGWLDVT